MGDSAPVYAREIEDPVEAVFESGGPVGLSWSSRVVLRQGDTSLATVHLAQETNFRRAFGSIDFGARSFTLTMPPDRTLGEMLAEFFTRYRRRRVWRAGSGIVTEIRDITQDEKSALKGTFQRDGTSYVIERPINTGFLGRTEGDIRVMANNREVARIEESLADKAIMVITPDAPVRLDVIAIAFDLGMSLSLPRGGGGAGSGGGGGDGGGGC
jgi:hypothetical protein